MGAWVYLSPGSWCTQGFVCALQESVAPVLWKFCNQIPLTFKVKFPGGFQSFCQMPRLGNLLCVLELSQQCKNFFHIIVLQFVGHLLSGSMVGLIATSSKRIYAACSTSQVCCCQNLCPRRKPLLTHASQETLKHSKTGQLSLLWDLCVLVWTRFCWSPLSTLEGMGMIHLMNPKIFAKERKGMSSGKGGFLASS